MNRVLKRILGDPQAKTIKRLKKRVRTINDLAPKYEKMSDKELREQMKGMKKTEQAKAIGKAVAERAKSKGISSVVFDRGGFRYVGRVKALADGAREGGLQF